MIPLHDVENSRASLLGEIQNMIGVIRSLVQREIGGLAHGLEVLEQIRQAAYEDLNQIPHEALLLDAASEIQKDVFANQQIRWKWNPRQTGSGDEPDLQGSANDQVLVSVEATASASPKGSIGQRMAKTLEKLSMLPGMRMYYVCTPKMAKRARTRVERMGYQIEVRVRSRI